LALSMMSLHTWGVPVAHSMGKEQFLAFYLSAGVFSTWFSHVVEIARKRPKPGLGAVSIFGISNLKKK
jgi:membrane associated rhomboid family serine protease